MEISFDPAKRDVTLRERGLDFADAGQVFAGTIATAPAREGYGEERFITAGYLGGRMVVLVWNLAWRSSPRHFNEALSWKRRASLAQAHGSTRMMRRN